MGRAFWEDPMLVEAFGPTPPAAQSPGQATEEAELGQEVQGPQQTTPRDNRASMLDLPTDQGTGHVSDPDMCQTVVH